MDNLLSLAIVTTVVFFHDACSQQVYMPKEKQDSGQLVTENPLSRIHKNDNAAPDESESMRALLDVSRQSDLTYEDYYDSLPYYDILDYLYLDNNDDNTTHKEEHTDNESQTTTAGDFTNSPDTTMKNNGSDNVHICDVMTHIGCDVNNFERCDSVTKKCRCLNGYVRETFPAMKDPTHCRAAKFLHGRLNIRVPDNTKTLSNHGLHIVRTKLWDYLTFLMKKYSIGKLLKLYISSEGVTSSDSPSVLVLPYEIALDRSASTVTDRLHDLLHQELPLYKIPEKHEASEEMMNIIGEPVVGVHNGSRSDLDIFTSLVEIHACASQDHSHCDTNAMCRVENGSQTCVCLPGFQDMSPDITRLPGEVCQDQCRCRNGGICVANINDYSVKECSCISWYLGPRCEINGKELLIICCSSLGCLVLFIILICCCYQAHVRHRNRQAESSLFRFTPDTSILKLPRVWMESRYQNKEISPQSMRRMSLATECSPYFDGYVHLNISPLQVAYGTSQGPTTMSSHSMYRHYFS